MDLYFLRHASAGSKKAPTPRQDEKRPLDGKGIAQAKQMGRLLEKLGVAPDALLSSPLTRAIQTATLAAEQLKYGAEIIRHEALRPDANYDQFLDLVRHYGKNKVVILVGHNPNFSEFLSLLISRGASEDVIELKKGAVAKVEVQPRNRASLQWTITPKLLDAAKELGHGSATTRSRPKTSRK